MMLHGPQEVEAVIGTDRQSLTQRSQHLLSKGNKTEGSIKPNRDKTYKRQIREQPLEMEAGMCLMIFLRGHQHRKTTNNQ